MLKVLNFPNISCLTAWYPVTNIWVSYPGPDNELIR